MPDSGWVEWLQYKGFYAGIVLALVALGFALGRKRNRRTDASRKRESSKAPRSSGRFTGTKRRP